MFPRRNRPQPILEATGSGAVDGGELKHIPGPELKLPGLFIALKRCLVLKCTLHLQGSSHFVEQITPNTGHDVDAQTGPHTGRQQTSRGRHPMPHLHLDPG